MHPAALESSAQHARAFWLPLLFSFPLLALFIIPVMVLLVQGLTSPVTSDASLEAIFTALQLSFFSTGVTVLVMLIFGTPLAFLLARYRFPGKRLLQVMVELPIVMPPAVAGLALLRSFGRNGAFGGLLLTIGLTLPFSILAVIVAQCFVAAPFYIRAAQTGFTGVNRDLEDAASVDGAGKWEILRFITLPLAAPALLTGLILGWARALGEFGATIFFAGNFQGRTQTMPLLIYSLFERNTETETATQTALILLALAFLALLLAGWIGRNYTVDN